MEKEALLYEKLDKERIHCYLCSHHCRIAPSGFGFCGVRQNRQGTLFTLVYAETIAAQVDPIEKKPLYHFLPGSNSFSIATIGCNFRCGFCQNWQISQASKRDGASSGRPDLLPKDVVAMAAANDCASISYTYTEPTIFFEYAYDCAQAAHAAGLKNVFVTNGYMTKEALDMIRPYLDAANVDLKSFREEFYTTVCKAHVEPVRETIRRMKEAGIWVEVTTLIIPGQNDSSEELREIAAFIASVDTRIPWHISAFHPDYQFLDRMPTGAEALRRAEKLGFEAGLRYVYRGNVAETTATLCPSCHKPLLKRLHFDILENHLAEGRCSFCGLKLDGIY